MKKTLKKLSLGIMMGLLLLSVSGCGTFGRTLPVLISRDLQWSIPQGHTFKAMQKPAYPEITEFVAPEPLVVLYKGRLLELEKEANNRAFRKAKAAKSKGVMFGAIGSLLACLSGLIGWLKLKKKK